MPPRGQGFSVSSRTTDLDPPMPGGRDLRVLRSLRPRPFVSCHLDLALTIFEGGRAWGRPSCLPQSRPLAARLCRWVFGLCSIDFGLAHLTGIQATAAMVPRWVPLSGAFWTVFAGIAFVLAGLAILTGVLDVWASRLLGLMLLIFSVMTLTPMIFAAPHNHVAWGGDAYNLTAVGAAWIFAD